MSNRGVWLLTGFALVVGFVAGVGVGWLTSPEPMPVPAGAENARASAAQIRIGAD